MYYVIRNDLSGPDALTEGLCAEFPVLENAKAYADGLKMETGKNYNIFKVEWVTTTQTLGELFKDREERA